MKTVSFAFEASKDNIGGKGKKKGDKGSKSSLSNNDKKKDKGELL